MAEQDLIGAVLEGRYKIVERVAEGAMGVVYRGERLKLGRAVAIKFLHPWNADELAARKRFEMEAKAMARLEHPHCAAVIDVGEYEGAPYVVMDFVRGTNLRDLLDEGPVAVPRAVEITKQVLAGLAHAHDLGIIHRDIKPANVMLSEKTGMGEQVRILDFGLARFRGVGSSLTVGMAIGTPSYMAPEQCIGATCDGRTDLYACGVLLYELLTGEKPFANEDPLETLRDHRERPPPRLADKLPGVAFGALEDVVAKALEKRAEDRYQTAQEFSSALDRASVPAPVPEPVPVPVPVPETARPRDTSAPSHSSLPPPPDRRRLYIYIGASVAALALIGIIAAALSATGSHSASSSDAALSIARADAAPSSSAAADLVARARAAADAGDREAALKDLTAGRRLYPDSAAIPFLMGQLYFDKLWFTDGLKQFRAALRLDPSLRSDETLIKTVLRGFLTTPDTDAGLASFLRNDLGDAARPALEETARDHPNPKLRARAAALLR